MVIGKLVTKLIQSLPTWEVTKYYGRVCIYQLKCLKYRAQTSEAWFNFKCKFMPGSLREEAECEEVLHPKTNDEHLSGKQKKQEKKTSDTLTEQKYQRAKKKLSMETCNSCNTNEYATRNRNKRTECNEKTSENQKCSMHNDYNMDRQKKAKRAQ